MGSVRNSNSAPTNPMLAMYAAVEVSSCPRTANIVGRFGTATACEMSSMKRVKNTNASGMMSVLFTAPEEAVATISSCRSALNRAALLRMVLPEWQKVVFAVAMNGKSVVAWPEAIAGASRGTN